MGLPGCGIAITFRPIGEPLAHQGPVDCLAFNCAGTIIATASRDGTARLWDAETGIADRPSACASRCGAFAWHLIPTTGGSRRRAPTEWHDAGVCRLPSPEMSSGLRAGFASRPSSSLTTVMRSTARTSWRSGTFADDCKSWVGHQSSDAHWRRSVSGRASIGTPLSDSVFVIDPWAEGRAT